MAWADLMKAYLTLNKPAGAAYMTGESELFNSSFDATFEMCADYKMWRDAADAYGALSDGPHSWPLAGPWGGHCIFDWNNPVCTSRR